MQSSSIEQIDRAALTLLQALAQHEQELAPYFEAGHLATLKEEITNLRRAMLGLQMGPLYWETPAENIDALLEEDIGSSLDLEL